jgi:hypothetical protein
VNRSVGRVSQCDGRADSGHEKQYRKSTPSSGTATRSGAVSIS